MRECVEEEYVPDPHHPRGDVPESETGGTDASDSAEGGLPAEGGTGGESAVPDGSDQREDRSSAMSWPTRDPELEDSRPDGGEQGAGSAGMPSPGAPHPDATQRIRRVGADPRPAPGVGNNTEHPRRDDAHNSSAGPVGSTETTDPGVSRRRPVTPPPPAPGGRWPGARDAGPPTTRIAPVAGPSPSADDQPTRQFSLPNLDRPPHPGSSRPGPNHPGPSRPGHGEPGRGGPGRGGQGRGGQGFRGQGADRHGNAAEETDPARTSGFAVRPDTPSDDGFGDDHHAKDWTGEAADDPHTDAPEPAGTSRKLIRRSLLVAGALLVVVLLGVGIALGRLGLFGSAEDPVAAPPAPVRLQAHIRPVDGSASVPTTPGLTSALAPAVADPALGTFGGVVIDAASGRTLWQEAAGRPLVPASTAKLLTTSAALLAVDHDFRFTTKVVRGSRPGSIVLVGGGDPTLSGLPEGRPTVYPDAARLDELVAEVERATKRPVTSIKVDVGRYTGPELAPGWIPSDVDNGYVAPIQPVMVSGGRADPTEDVSPRSSTPALDAGRELASRLGVPESAVSLGAAPGGAPVLGSVRSATLQRMVRTVLLHSDNVLAEALARQVAVATGHEPSFAGAARAVRDVLSRNGFDLGGTTTVDGSGLSVLNRVTPELLGSLLRAAAAPLPETSRADGSSGRREATAELRPLMRALPVAGGSGSLAERYQAAASRAQGWVRAKTGTLTDVNSLAGTVVTSDGRLLTFAFMSNGTPAGVARPALDKVAAALRSCGCR